MGEGFWAFLVERGAIRGNPEYYSSGQATPEEVGHAIATANDFFAGQGSTSLWHVLVDEGLIEGNPEYYSSGQATPEEVDHAIATADEALGGAPAQEGSTEVTASQASAEVIQAETAVSTGIGGGGPDEETQLTILTSNEMRWYFDRSSGSWYVGYGLPGSDREMIFSASAEQMDALFGSQQRPTQYETTTLGVLTRRVGTVFAGDISEMEGTGSFESEIERVQAEALDSGLLPSWAKETDEVLDILYVSQAEGRSLEWIIEEIGKTSSFAARFPNIAALKSSGNLTTAEAVEGWLEYEADVNRALQAVGSEQTATPEIVGALLGKGYSIDQVNTSIGLFDRMQKYAPALSAFNSILASQGLDPITSLQDQFDFMAGQAPQEVYDIWEASSVSEAAAAAGLGDVFSAESAMRFALASQGNTSLSDATQMFQEAAGMLLRLRHEVQVEQFGLNTEDLIDLQLGNPPSSGVSAAELTENINRAILSAQKTISGNRSNPFISFTDKGVPRRASLGSIRQQ